MGDLPAPGEMYKTPADCLRHTDRHTNPLPPKCPHYLDVCSCPAATILGTCACPGQFRVRRIIERGCPGCRGAGRDRDDEGTDAHDEQ